MSRHHRAIICTRPVPLCPALGCWVTSPRLLLGYDRLQILALAPHELTTDALKHGALKQDGGRLDIRWSVDGSASGFPLLLLVWQKSGVPCRQTSPVVATAELSSGNSPLPRGPSLSSASATMAWPDG